MKKLLKYSFGLLLFAFLSTGCSGTEKVSSERTLHDSQTRYMSAAGSDFLRNQLNRGMESVIRIQITAGYRTFQFDLDDLPTRAELEGTDFSERALDTMLDHNSRAGSALVLSNRRGNSVLLTPSHVVSYPDTVWHFTEGSVRTPQGRVEAVSVRESISRFIIGSHGIYEFEVGVNDPDQDLALMIKRWGSNDRPELTPLQIEAGNYEALEWSDQVYAIGYPLGVGMITRGMVSKSIHSPRRSFVFDASINRGFSGGAIFAERSDGSGLEWVGMVLSASASHEEYLVPERDSDMEFHPDLEYRGAVFVERKQRINYGITYAVGIDQIREFINNHRDILSEQEIRLPEL
ncbi:serine protease [Rhodohalobacter sp. SW132]|uniref:S1 family peptidase n=1 Tax=Rhodohalobacter sp. SW132 TaxID=2293433 RepID=UPI000E26673D|nr:serine protease [Rhodohalobacter sp. SW132]REL24052.1 serine protease [Rhodohalobacter sp. SW132]